MADVLRKCKYCKQRKSEEEFRIRSKTSRIGWTYRGRCKSCWNENTRIRSSSAQNRYVKKLSEIRRRYGITIDEYENKLRMCCNVCEICGDPPYSKGTGKHPLYIDHNHKTGKVRGLLCTRCNTFLHYLEDTSFVSKAEQYINLDRSSSQKSLF